ncbi:hypothetical protein [Rhizobium ruizarguesonis]|uniref:hypothetical protein n=1 Tax=Rhizobium ruizarguesonis TaxID=2081791 RepID=UPI001030A077|nr:hypothetical protein [Rhizobium ruizarguesonis]TAY81986.1 hypothetical protein ELH86_24900 [Rhizobium ruizarguesonis]
MMHDFARRRDAREILNRVYAAMDAASVSKQPPSFYFLEKHLEKMEYYDPENSEQWAEDYDMVVRLLGEFQTRSPYWLAYEWDSAWGNHDYIIKVRPLYGGIDMIWSNVLEGTNWRRTNFMFLCFSEWPIAKRFRFDHEPDGTDYRIERQTNF